MMTLAKLIAVAAWCGYNGNVDQCRIEIKQCLDSTHQLEGCFTGYKLYGGYTK